MCKKENDTLDKYQDSPAFADREEMRDNVVRKGSSLSGCNHGILSIDTFISLWFIDVTLSSNRYYSINMNMHYK